MRSLLFVICFAFILSSASSQFARVQVNTGNIPSTSLTRSAGDNDFVSLVDGELHHITMNPDSSFNVAWIENSLANIRNFVMHDIDRDGDKDIICFIYEVGIFYVYIKQDGQYIYFPEWNIPGTKAYNLHAQDFDDDGYEDLMINSTIFLNTGVNKRTFLFRAPYSDISFGKIHFLDCDADGDKDLLLTRSNQIIVVFNTGETNPHETLILDNELGSLGWTHLIKTTQGDKLLYLDWAADSIKHLAFSAGSYSIHNIVKSIFNPDPKAIGNYDLDLDGNDELVFHVGSILNVVKYDVSDNTGNSNTAGMSSPNPTAFGFLEMNDGPAIFTASPADFRIYKPDNNLVPVLYSKVISSVTSMGNGFQDFDGDDLVDVISSNNLKRYLGEGAFGPINQFTYPSTGGNLQDYDADGDLDYVKEDAWYANLGNLTFGNSIPIINTDPTPDPEIFFTTELIRADLDMDGDIDILTYNNFGEPLQLLENNNNNFFEDPRTLATLDHISGDVVDVQIIDLNLDGTKDILFAAASGMIMLKGSPGLEFDQPVLLYNDELTPGTLQVNDINADGFPDILLGTYEFDAGSVYGEVVLYLGEEDVSQPIRIHLGEGTHKAAFGNIDQLGWLDIVYLNGDGLFWVQSQDGSSFITHQIEIDFLENENFVVTDADSDQDDDIILYAGNQIFYFLNGETLHQASNCPDKDLYYFNQDQLDRYAARYGTCEVLGGSLNIGPVVGIDKDIVDLSSLIHIKEIKGGLDIRQNNLLPDLTGISNLERVGGTFYLSNPYAPNIEGVEKLRYVGGDFILNGMFTIVAQSDLSEFKKLDTILGNVIIDNCDITSIKPILQSVFYGDLIIKNSSPLTDMDSLNVVDSILGTLTLYDTHWPTLEGFSNLVHVQGLDVRGNPLLTSLGILHDIVKIEGNIDIKDNPLLIADSGLEALEHIEGSLNIRNSDCAIFPELNYIGDECYIDVQTLNDLSFSKLSQVGTDLTIISNLDDSLTQFSKLDTINGNLALLSNAITSIDGFHHIRKIGGNLEINYNQKLKGITTLEDSLFVEGLWAMKNNDSLQSCNSYPLCRHIKRNGEFDISNNGPACSDISSIQCLDNFFSGFVYHDYNLNQQKEQTEAVLSNIRVVHHNQSDTMITSTNGYYLIRANEGDPLSVEMVVPPDWEATGETQIQVNSFLPGEATNYGNNFGLIPQFQKHDLSLSYNVGNFICNRPYSLDLILSNQGTYAEVSLIKLHYPEHAIPDQNYTGYTTHDPINREMTFEMDTIFPFFNQHLSIPFLAPSSDFIQEEFHTIIELYTRQNNGNEFLQAQTIETGLLCSYDPNDKLVRSSNGSTDVHYASDDVLIYTVRFQNTGNYYAEHVHIVDTLSQNLDISSFAIIGASHPVEIHQEGRVIHFYFNAIFLPDSARDFTGSQGYVMFSIKPIGQLEPGVELHNTAGIYFDENEVISTNQVKSLVVKLTDFDDPRAHETIRLYPNPVRDVLWLQENGKALTTGFTYRIYTTSGTQISSGYATTSHIDVQYLEPGMYVFEIESEDGQKRIARLVKI